MRSLAVLAILGQLATLATAQELVFSADAAVAVDNGGEEAGANAGAENVAAEEVSGDDGPGPVAELARQDLIPVGTFPRTCTCSTPKTVVRSCQVTSELDDSLTSNSVCRNVCFIT